MKQSGRSGAGIWLFRGGLLLGSVLGIGASAQPEAHAQEASPTKAECARAYESSQESRAAGQLQDTIEKLAVCARAECPGFVQKDCARWLEEVESELPSVVVQAPGLDAEAAKAVRIAIDGKDLPGALGGPPVPLDPGRHELVATRPGHEPITRVIVAQQGVHERAVTLDFGELAPPTPRSASEQALDVPPDTSSSLRPYAYVAWGVGAVGLGAFAVFGTLGRADEQALKDDCPNATNDPTLVAPGICYKPEVDDRKSSYEREFLFADIGLVTGIVGVAAGTTLFILSETQSSAGASASDESRGSAARWQIDVSPLTGGAYASVGRAF
jgi:hypothetical protein